MPSLLSRPASGICFIVNYGGAQKGMNGSIAKYFDVVVLFLSQNASNNFVCVHSLTSGSRSKMNELIV